MTQIFDLDQTWAWIWICQPINSVKSQEIFLGILVMVHMYHLIFFKSNMFNTWCGICYSLSNSSLWITRPRSMKYLNSSDECMQSYCLSFSFYSEYGSVQMAWWFCKECTCWSNITFWLSGLSKFSSHFYQLIFYVYYC